MVSNSSAQENKREIKLPTKKREIIKQSILILSSCFFLFWLVFFVFNILIGTPASFVLQLPQGYGDDQFLIILLNAIWFLPLVFIILLFEKPRKIIKILGSIAYFIFFFNGIFYAVSNRINIFDVLRGFNMVKYALFSLMVLWAYVAVVALLVRRKEIKKMVKKSKKPEEGAAMMAMLLATIILVTVIYFTLDTKNQLSMILKTLWDFAFLLFSLSLPYIHGQYLYGLWFSKPKLTKQPKDYILSKK